MHKTLYHMKLSEIGQKAFEENVKKVTEGKYDDDIDIEIVTPLALIRGEHGEFALYCCTPTLDSTIKVLQKNISSEFGDIGFTGVELKSEWFDFKPEEVPEDIAVVVMQDCA